MLFVILILQLAVSTEVIVYNVITTHFHVIIVDMHTFLQDNLLTHVTTYSGEAKSFSYNQFGKTFALIISDYQNIR